MAISTNFSTQLQFERKFKAQKNKALSSIERRLRKALVVTGTAIGKFVAKEAIRRVPRDTKALEQSLENVLTRTFKVRQTFRAVQVQFDVGEGEVRKYAELMHEILEIGESDLSFDVDNNRRVYDVGEPPRALPWRLGPGSVRKDRRSSVDVGGKFIQRAITENRAKISAIKTRTFKL